MNQPLTIADVLLMQDKLKYIDPLPWHRRGGEGYLCIAQTANGFYVSKIIGGNTMYLHPDGYWRRSAWENVSGKESLAYYPDFAGATLAYLDVVRKTGTS